MGSRIFYGIIFLLFISVGTVYAQESLPLIAIQTDDDNYYEGEIIKISGQVNKNIKDTPVTLQIFTENGDLVSIAQINISEDNTFSHSIKAEGQYWQKQGEYKIKASYGEAGVTEVKFGYISDAQLIPVNFPVDTGNETFDVKYTIKGGIVKDITVNARDFSLEIQINSTDDGEILLELPREFIDAEKQNGNDETFIVLIDGIEVPYKESSTDSKLRTITIEFKQNDSDIKIIGTYIIPEFGTIAMMILMVGILSTILVARNKFQIKI